MGARPRAPQAWPPLLEEEASAGGSSRMVWRREWPRRPGHRAGEAGRPPAPAPGSRRVREAGPHAGSGDGWWWWWGGGGVPWWSE
jgi:hypothetical protein